MVTPSSSLKLSSLNRYQPNPILSVKLYEILVISPLEEIVIDIFFRFWSNIYDSAFGKGVQVSFPNQS